MNWINKILLTGQRSKTLSAKDSQLFDQIKSNDICIDCGANIGDVTAQMSKYGATVYAFEPNPFAFEKLKSRFKNNSNVVCHNQGVLDKNSSMKLYSHENSDEDEVKWSVGSSLVHTKGNVLQEKFEVVEVIDLTEFIEKSESPIKLLKLDVEGVEVEILNKLIDKGLHKSIEMILVETHDHKMPELKKRTDLLRDKIKKNDIKNIDLNWI